MFYLLHRWGVSGTDPRSWGVNSQESHFPVCLTAPCTAAGSWSCSELWPSHQPPSTGHGIPELGAGLSSCSEHICSRGQVFSNLQNCSQHSAAALLSCCCFCALRGMSVSCCRGSRHQMQSLHALVGLSPSLSISSCISSIPLLPSLIAIASLCFTPLWM